MTCPQALAGDRQGARRAARRSGQRDITAYLSNGGDPRSHAQQIAGHASPKTTKLYNRTADNGDGRRAAYSKWRLPTMTPTTHI